MVTMLLGGLWHGSSWLFLIWGGLNGLGLIVHKQWTKISPFKNNDAWGYKLICVLITLTFISFTRIFFRSSSLQIVDTIFYRISNHFGLDLLFQVIYGYRAVFALMAIGYLIHWIPERYKVIYRNWFAKQSYYAMGAIIIFAVFIMYQLMSGEMQPFIYFQF
jgi:D-alanyl-lipoteichoic acid acyltransferase DltB (MBOAT superfamily)